jgi:hypothetical protein
MPSIKEIYNSIGEVELNADSINLNVDGLEALASTQQADIALIKADVDDIRIDLANGVTSLPQTGNVTEASTKTITTGGTHQQVFAANADRKFLLIQNVSDTDMNLGIGYNPTASTGIFLSKSGGGVVFESGFIPTQEIRILCATTGKAFVALQG